MKKLVTLIIAGLLLTSCGGSTTNVYIYSNDKLDSIKIDSNSTIIDTTIIDNNDSVDVVIEKHEEG